MDLRSAFASLGGPGAADNARRSLDQWARAQDEVAALLDRMAARDRAPVDRMAARDRAPVERPASRADHPAA
jgi:hypothetical protein